MTVEVAESRASRSNPAMRVVFLIALAALIASLLLPPGDSRLWSIAAVVFYTSWIGFEIAWVVRLLRRRAPASESIMAFALALGYWALDLAWTLHYG